jgi:hypothetical protein
MESIVYCLKKCKEKDELHIFRAKLLGKACIAEDESICKKMKKSESEATVFTCYSEDAARMECAKQGRNVCGSCVIILDTVYR